MVKIKILRSTICGKQRVNVGDVVEASETDAITLCNRKKAERIQEDGPKKRLGRPKKDD